MKWTPFDSGVRCKKKMLPVKLHANQSTDDQRCFFSSSKCYRDRKFTDNKAKLKIPQNVAVKTIERRRCRAVITTIAMNWSFNVFVHGTFTSMHQFRLDVNVSVSEFPIVFNLTPPKVNGILKIVSTLTFGIE